MYDMAKLPTPEAHPYVIQCRVSERQYRFLKLAAATDYTSASYSKVLREIIDQAIEQTDPKWRKQLDLSAEDFAQAIVDNL